MTSHVESLDHLLIESDADSQSWCDGLGHESASDLLAALGESQWSELRRLCPLRGVKWRECLASALSPKQGTVATALLLALTGDQEGDVSFYALSQVAFYCGVNAKAGGAYLDADIQLPSFVAAARAVPDLAVAIERLNSRCAAHFRRRFELLALVVQA